jgi:hypothetical protein
MPLCARFALLLLAYAGTIVVHAETTTLDQLSWLAGCWSDESADPGSGENWMTPAGGTMLGVGRTVKAGRTAQFEYLQIRASAAGGLVYTALPSGQKQTDFNLLSVAGKRFVFENLQHDFPQRIIYSREDDDRMTARIEGTRGGQLKGFEYQLRRTSCTANR